MIAERIARSLIALATTALVLREGTAFADEPDAERLFREGRGLMLEGRFAEACPKLADSQRLDPRGGTLLNLAVCHERQGKIAHAWREYEEALAGARRDNQTDRARLAEQRRAILEPRVPWLRVSVPVSASQLIVTVDGVELDPVAFGMAQPIDPGSHVVVARVGNKVVFEERTDLSEGDRRTVAIRVEPDAAGAVPFEVPASWGAASQPAPPPATPSPRRRKWIFEAGIYGAYVAGRIHAPLGGNDRRGLWTTQLVNEETQEATSCDAVGCNFHSVDGMQSAGLGLTAFVGHAVLERLDVGVRLLGGGNPVRTYHAAMGPEVRYRFAPWLDVGVWGGLGAAAFYVDGYVDPPPHYNVLRDDESFQSDNKRTLGSFGNVASVGLDISCAVATLGPAKLVVQSTPFVLIGPSRSALAFPLGMALRFD